MAGRPASRAAEAAARPAAPSTAPTASTPARTSVSIWARAAGWRLPFTISQARPSGGGHPAEPRRGWRTRPAPARPSQRGAAGAGARPRQGVEVARDLGVWHDETPGACPRPGPAHRPGPDLGERQLHHQARGAGGEQIGDGRGRAQEPRILPDRGLVHGPIVDGEDAAAGRRPSSGNAGHATADSTEPRS